MYVKWSWLSCFATVLWTALVIQDWYLNNEYFLSEFEYINHHSKKQLVENRTDEKLQTVDEINDGNEDNNETYIKVTNLKLDHIDEILPPVEVNIPIINNKSEKILLPHDELNEEIPNKVLSNHIFNLTIFILLIIGFYILRYLIISMINFWYRRNDFGEELLEHKPIPNHTVNITPGCMVPSKTSTDLLLQKQSVSKIPTYRFKRSLSDLNMKPKSNLKPWSAIKSKDESKIGLLKESVVSAEEKLTLEREVSMKLRQQIDQLIDENKNLSRKLAAISCEKKELSKHLVNLVNSNDKLKREYDEIKRANEMMHNKLQNLKNEIKKSASEKYDIQRKLINLENYNCKMRQNLEQAKTVIKKYEHKICELEKEIVQLKTRLHCFSPMQAKSRRGTANSTNEPIRAHEKPERLSKKPSGISICSSGNNTKRKFSNERHLLRSPCEANQIKKNDVDNLITTINFKKHYSYKCLQRKIPNEKQDERNEQLKTFGPERGENTLKMKSEGDLKISEIFHTCSENSSGESSECGLASDAEYTGEPLLDEDYLNCFTPILLSNTTITNPNASESDLSTSIGEQVEILTESSGSIDNLNLFNTTEINEEQLDQIINKIEQDHPKSDDIKRQTRFLSKYFKQNDSSDNENIFEEIVHLAKLENYKDDIQKNIINDNYSLKSETSLPKSQDCRNLSNNLISFNPLNNQLETSATLLSIVVSSFNANQPPNLITPIVSPSLKKTSEHDLSSLD